MTYQTINPATAVRMIEESNGVTVTFRKKDSTEIRVMRCLPLGKGVNVMDTRNLLVYDLDKQQLRTIRKAGIRFVQTSLETFIVKAA